MSYRFCFYAIHTAPWVLGLGWLLNMLLYRGQPCGYTSPVEWVFIGLLVFYGLRVYMPVGFVLQERHKMEAAAGAKH